MSEYNFSTCKLCFNNDTKVKYHIKDDTEIYECPSCKFHYINYLADTDSIQENVRLKYNRDDANNRFEEKYKKQIREIENSLHYNKKKFEDRVDLVYSCTTNKNSPKCFDMGAGGGLFLNLMKQKGADVYGNELSIPRIHYSKRKFDISLSVETIESDYWQKDYSDYFDVLTLWDTIEHVNFPVETLKNAYNLLAKDGIICLDTPIRNSLFYVLGEISYRLSFGRFPAFLNMMYSNLPLGHKHIFSSKQLEDLLESLNFKIVHREAFTELGLHPHSYVTKTAKKSSLGFLKWISPELIVKLIHLVNPKNKILIIAQK